MAAFSIPIDEKYHARLLGPIVDKPKHLFLRVLQLAHLCHTDGIIWHNQTHMIKSLLKVSLLSN